ncbi:MAG: TRAP transporter permease [Minwuia sp.]|uniref:TRAP transporter permease n=1 Tax=Minwuia sp. TaxID=2493630 RepID=UPI003A847BB8
MTNQAGSGPADPSGGTPAAGQKMVAADTEFRYRPLSPFWRTVMIVITVVTVLLSVYKLFNLGHTFGYVPIDTQYFFILLALLLPLCILVFPIRPVREGGSPMDGAYFAFDLLLMAAAVGANLYLFVYAKDIVNLGWEWAAPTHIQIAAGILWVLVLEATRRSAGFSVFIIVLIFSLYPLFGENLPEPLETFENEPFGKTVAYHAISSESILGIPFRAFANLVIGFLMFGVALQYTGGGKFFLNLAFSLLGHVRGGPAKVAIFSSGLMGSMSGSVITNVLTTGALSIPAMKRTGFKAHYAGGVEACASTGGVLMPPIMGATAFIMAIYLNVPYSEIIIAAAIPSFLYFFGLFMQIDSYAARAGLEGLPKTEMPRLRDTIKEGWHYIFVFFLLVFMLLYLQREALAPYYATVLLVVINQITPHNRWKMADLSKFVIGVGRLFAELAAILAGIGMIVGSLSMTAKISTLANELLSLAGGDVFLLLLMGALASFIMGIGVTVTVAYIILAITLAPALTQSGLNPMAVHMFMLYWGMLSFITPPVALGAFAAASLAGSNPMRTGFEAMRLGSVIYFIPFFFVLNPGLIMQGTVAQVLTVTVTAVIGVILLASALQGYLIGIGRLNGNQVLQWPIRLAIGIAAILFLAPGGKLTGFTHVELVIAGLVLAVPAMAVAWFTGRQPARA